MNLVSSSPSTSNLVRQPTEGAIKLQTFTTLSAGSFRGLTLQQIRQLRLSQILALGSVTRSSDRIPNLIEMIIQYLLTRLHHASFHTPESVAHTRTRLLEPANEVRAYFSFPL